MDYKKYYDKYYQKDYYRKYYQKHKKVKPRITIALDKELVDFLNKYIEEMKSTNISKAKIFTILLRHAMNVDNIKVKKGSEIREALELLNNHGKLVLPSQLRK